MIAELLLNRMREEAARERRLCPQHDQIASAITPLWAQVEAGLRARLGRQAVVHRDQGMIVIEGSTGHRVGAVIQIFQDHADVEFVSAVRRRRARVIHSLNAPLDRLESVLEGLEATLAFERIWAAVSEPTPDEGEPG